MGPADPPDVVEPPRRWASRDMVLVSGLTLAAQAGIAASQFVFAAMFGASADTDAFFAALSPPLYLTTVLIASLSVVFVPIFIERRRIGGTNDAARVASGTLNLVAIGLVVIAAAGAIFADPIIGLTAPGLPPAARELARGLAVILWPSVVGSGLVVLLTSIWQIDSRFGWPAVVPVIGAVVNLALMVILGRTIGVSGAAIAWTVSLILQAGLLAPVVARTWRPSLGLDHPGVRAVLVALAPLAFASVFIRASTLLERYLGSELPSGQLSQLTYASRIVAVLGVLASAGPAAVLFPRMAEDVSALDFAGLRSRAALGLRSLWLLVAPCIALLVVLAEPAVRLVFEHGAFTRADSDAVAVLTRIYAPSVIAIALSAVTGRAIYALKAVRLLAVVGAIEGLLYIAYTTVLARRLGAEGIALGYTVYFLGSITWQLVYLRHVLDARGGMVIRSFLITSGVAVVAGIAAWLATLAVSGGPPAVIVAIGGTVGMGVYVLGLTVTRGVGATR
ncbi:MAG: polysaccharide biosynthesis C-terminal domain-containing protein [Chloroflexota bacterium]|nr:polysaccharide biosynthesis C-terminal domain-containing protein [Chloroflexota bacterium]